MFFEYLEFFGSSCIYEHDFTPPLELLYPTTDGVIIPHHWLPNHWYPTTELYPTTDLYRTTDFKA